jgi:hypothetical protein
MPRSVLPYLKSKVHQISVRLLIPLIDELHERGVDTQELLQRNGTTLAVVLSMPYRIHTRRRRRSGATRARRPAMRASVSRSVAILIRAHGSSSVTCLARASTCARR